VFRFFKDEAGTVLDIGAHFGYSAASIWAAGATTSILSFEPNPWHAVCLDRIKAIRPGKFDYATLGIGDVPRAVCFVMPVIEGVGISGLSSAAIETELDWAIPGKYHYIRDELPAGRRAAATGFLRGELAYRTPGRRASQPAVRCVVIAHSCGKD